MRFKKGFTLAEVLIVLMVIGVIAMLTVPSLMNGVSEAQYKTGFKKAYNALTNIASMEKISGQLPAVATADGATQFMAALNSNLSVKEYASQNISAGTALPISSFGSSMKVNGQTFGSGTNPIIDFTPAKAAAANSIKGTTAGWIISEDNLAYTVLYSNLPANDNCKNKSEINAKATLAEILQATCNVVVVDVNGLSKGPNMLEPQVLRDLVSSTNMEVFTGDQFLIFVGLDGVASGAKATSVSGRLVADVK